MSAASTAVPRRLRENMSEPGDPSPSGAAVRVEDIERALVLAREVVAATASGGAANLRIDHLHALFANGNGRVDPSRIEAALAAAGLTVDPPLADKPTTVSLRAEGRRATLAPKGAARGSKRTAAPSAGPEAGDDDQPPRPAGVAAYQAATGALRQRKRPAAAAAPSAEPGGVSIDDAQRRAAADQAAQNTPKAIAALMPALVLPVLAASFLGPIFGATFAGLALLASAMLSRPGALADGKLGPIRMPASLARSFLLLSCGVALGALATSGALIAAGRTDTEPSDPNAPIEQPKGTQPKPATTTPPAPPAADQQRQQEREREAEAAAERRADRRAAARRRAARERRQRARKREATPPSGGGAQAPAVP